MERPSVWNHISNPNFSPKEAVDLLCQALQDPDNKNLTLGIVVATNPKYKSLLDGLDKKTRRLFSNFFNKWKKDISSNTDRGQTLKHSLHKAMAERERVANLTSQQNSDLEQLKQHLGKFISEQSNKNSEIEKSQVHVCETTAETINQLTNLMQNN